jgi:hypothetical protein
VPEGEELSRQWPHAIALGELREIFDRERVVLVRQPHMMAASDVHHSVRLCLAWSIDKKEGETLLRCLEVRVLMLQIRPHRSASGQLASGSAEEQVKHGLASR